MKEGLLTRLGRKAAPYLLATTLSLPIASCSRDITSPYQEPAPIEQYAQKAEQKIQSGNYSLEQMLSETQELAGPALAEASARPDIDVNHDNKENIFDLLYLLKVLGGTMQDTEKRCDVNQNGKTDIFDLITLLQVLGGNYGKYNVSGKVLGIHAGNPEYSLVPNAIVSFKDKNWNLVKADTADAQGNYSVSLPEGDYNMCVKAEDYWDYPISENNPFINGTPDHPEYNRTFYFEIEGLNSSLNKDGIILNKDIDYEFFDKVLKNGDDTDGEGGAISDGGLPVAKWEATPKDWVQEGTINPLSKQTLKQIIGLDFINFQSEIKPEIVEDSLQANVKHYFVPKGHPRIGNSAWASYEVYVDWNTNTITGARVWYIDGLASSEPSKGIFREEVSQSHMNLHDTFNPAYSVTTLYHDSQIAEDFTQLDRDDIGTIYHLVPKGH